MTKKTLMKIQNSTNGTENVPVIEICREETPLGLPFVI